MSRKAHINVVVSLDDLLCFKQVFEHAIARCQENMMDSLNGKDIKSYQFLEEIGNGAFGVVYRARQSDLREVAIKVISPYYANDPDFIRRFEKEAQIVARLEHPHIVRLYDYWRDVTGAYLVMQFLRGGSLKDLIERGPLNLDRIAALLSQIAEGLDFAHRHKVIHRDIKPDNIMLDEDGRTYVADFGIALDTGLTISDTQSGAIVGSPVYLSPEQAMSRPLGAQSDVYCLGIVLYQMLTGELPFNGTFTEILLKHVNEPVPEITSIPANVQVAVNDVLQKATNKKPEQRYSSTVDFAEAFKQAVSSQVAVSSVVPSTDALLFVPTARELEILSALVRGLQNAEIAAELHLSEGTIRNYLTEIYRKLGVRSRNQAREHVLKHGLFDSDGTVLKASLPIQAPPVPVNVINPYKGLQAFTYADADDFFGREALTDQLIERLVQPQRFIAIVGPSGSGKSSVIKAGLLPALGRGDLPGAEHWFVAEMMPKNRPLDQLEVLLQRQATSVHVNVGEQLRRDAHGLVRLAAMLLPDDDSELLLVIDQFEELFTLVDDETERQYFLDMIATAVTTEYSRVRVVITLRADFFDRPLCYARFGDLLRNHMETVLPLTAEELEQAIVRPASACGIQYEAGLVTRIVQDVLHQPGGLPLLQYALTELFERHEGQIIPRYAYDAIGGVAGALAREADALFLQQDGIGQKLIRQFFLRLVTPGDGTEDSRRRAERAELLSLTEAPDLMNEIIDAFVERRLLATDHDPNGRQPTVEVAHEALLRSWDHLRNWVNYSRAEVHLVRQVEQLSERWQKSDYDSGYLVQGSPLDELEPLLSSESVRLTPNEKAFLEASLKDRKQRKERDEARKAREAQIARRASSFQRASLLLGMMVIIAIVATLLVGRTAVDANRTLAGVPPTLTEVGQQVAAAEEREAAAVTAVSEGQATLDAVNTQVVIVEATVTQAAIVEDIITDVTQPSE